MIESLSVSNVATYGSQPELINDLSKFNFIFGSNGTGKTTIGRVIAEAEEYEHCHIKWSGGNKLQTLVYNNNFVDLNFKQLTEIPGVFTLGENDIKIQNTIDSEKLAIEQLEKEINNLKKTLGVGEELNGKTGELQELEDTFKDKCWAQKKRCDENFKNAFEGYRNNADKFKSKIIQESENNTAELVKLDDLKKRADTIFGETPIRETPIEAINSNSLINYEKHPVLSKKVLGKDDVDIAAMIKKLGNSDWVCQGRRFYEDNDGVCPFCQQDTSNYFVDSLAEYFDESFEADTKAINDLQVIYMSEATNLQDKINQIISQPSSFLDLETLKLKKQLLDSTIAANIQNLDLKKKEPSQLVELDSIVNTIEEIDILIKEANDKVFKHNQTVENINQERKTLTEQVWKFVLEELSLDLSSYKKNKSDLGSAITSLNKKIKEKEAEKNNKIQEIFQLEKQTTSIQPTINAINAMLGSFGFKEFSLAGVDERHYKLIRENGEDAKNTLSEGEYSFVTFLYFYHLLKGSNSGSGATTNRIVVFDDPVSSLDSDILFIVSSLIKKLFDEVRGGNSYIKQIFILTHNVYFHKEVSFNTKRCDKALSEETFWILRKEERLSKIVKHDSNPIKTSYELLWYTIKCESGSDLVLQNTMRRILEHYFKILGRINLDDIYNQFDAKHKLISKTLLSWVHDGSHSVHDDLYVSNGDASVETYRRIFKEIFEKAGHIAHYNMMMDEDFEEKVV